MKINLLWLLCLLFPLFAISQSDKQEAVISKFIMELKNGDKEAIAQRVKYPNHFMSFPIPPLQNKEDFIRHYDKFFDDSLLTIIINSDPSTDWAEVGWRGIMLHQGIVWIDENGSLMAINYSTKEQQEYREKALTADKFTLHKRLRNFEYPVKNWETASYRIRIDDIDGKGNYRLTAWNRPKSCLLKPDVIVENGIFELDGNGGNRYYLFVEGNIKYTCYVANLRAANAAPGWFSKTVDDKEKTREDVQIEYPN